jgi:integrase
LGAFAGLRTAELQLLDWKEIDLNRGFITVDANKAKSRQRRLVPISDNLRLWLMPCKQNLGAGLRASTPANGSGAALRRL